MNGFLHRLATQAIGSSHKLRPAMPQPYTTTADATPAVEPDKAVAALEEHVNVPRHPISNTVEGNSIYVQEQFPALPQAIIAGQPQEIHETKIMLSTPEMIVTQSAGQFNATPEHEIIRPYSPKIIPGRPQENISRTAALQAPILAAEIETLLPSHNSASGATASGETYQTKASPSPAASASPAPLLPLKNSARPSALNSGAVAQQGESKASLRQSQIEETTEVHVSIGRIEVTAVHESVPQKRQAAPASKPMTLDEYLARRRRQA